MIHCNQVCMYNFPDGGCLKPKDAVCPLSNIARGTNVLTNADHIRSLSDEELAKRNVHKTKTPVTGYYDYGESYTDYYDAWETSDGAIFWTEQPAIEYELHWLRQPYKEV